MNPGERVSMTIVGDVFIQRDDPESVFALVAPLLREADITFGNQEVALSDRGTPYEGKGTFKGEPKMVAALTSAGFDAVGLANNHSMDYGPEALLQTIEVLDRAGIAHAGAGRNIEEAHRPAIVERKGTRIAFLSYSSVFMPVGFAAEKDRIGIAVVRVASAYQAPPRVFEQPATPPIVITIPDPGDCQALFDDIKRAKALADMVVVSWHWGVSQGYRRIVSYQTELGRAAIDAGASLVVGHHPHVLQAIEVYKGGLICYSMGNFAFEMDSPHFDKESIILRCYIRDKHLERAAFVPAVKNDASQTEVIGLERGRYIVETMARLSAEFGTTFTPDGDEMVIGISK